MENIKIALATQPAHRAMNLVSNNCLIVHRAIHICLFSFYSILTTQASNYRISRPMEDTISCRSHEDIVRFSSVLGSVTKVFEFQPD